MMPPLCLPNLYSLPLKQANKQKSCKILLLALLFNGTVERLIYDIIREGLLPSFIISIRLIGWAKKKERENPIFFGWSLAFAVITTEVL